MNRNFRSVSLWLFLSLVGAGTAYAIPGRAVSESNVVQLGSVCKGVVKDALGETVIGATVVVKGTTNGTVTGLDGDFQLSNVEKGSVSRSRLLVSRLPR